jgi:hypothetical protein
VEKGPDPLSIHYQGDEEQELKSERKEEEER